MITITIQDIPFECKQPYVSGQDQYLGEAEAAVLNAARTEALRTAFARRVRTARDAVLKLPGRTGLNASEVLELQHQFADLDKSFHLSMPAPKLDPIGRAARHIAQEMVLAALRKKGLSRGDLEPGLFERHVAEVALRPAVRAEAERRVAATAGIVAEALDLE